MYFSIPDTTEISAQHSYILFNIHINGIHHYSLRYSQLRTFNDELQRCLPNSMLNIQPFPPKKFFNLSIREIDERRLLLERYLQSIVQNKSLISSTYFNNFFLNAQRETFLNQSLEKFLPDKISLTIFLLNENEILIENLSSSDNTNKLFNLCTKKLQLDHEYLPYFSLFFYEKNSSNEFNLIRPLFSFETPYISLKQIPNSVIVFKKSYWDINSDWKLFNNSLTYKLLLIQCEYDVKQNREFYFNDIYQQLDIYLNENSIKEYLLLIRQLKFYGYILIKQCTIHDLITDDIYQCLVAIGNNELICCLYNDEDDKEKSFLKDIVFKVTRIRCWKVNSIKENMNISFEYLIKKDTLKWITIYTEQAPLVSTCLQSMIDEILVKKINTIHPVSVTDQANNQKYSSNSLKIRTQSDLDRLNNNKLFDEGHGDDDL